MSALKHTAGPWSAHPAEAVEGGSPPYWYVNRGEGRYDPAVANTWGNNHEADARLIGAAPDLLAALKGCFELEAHLLGDIFGYEWLEEARAAISKATTPSQTLQLQAKGEGS